MYAIAFALDLVVHLIITQTYFKVSFETRQLVNMKVYQNDPDSLKNIGKFKRKLTLFNIVVLLLIATITVLLFLSTKTIASWAYNSAVWLDFLTYVLLTLSWGFTLWKLY